MWICSLQITGLLLAFCIVIISPSASTQSNAKNNEGQKGNASLQSDNMTTRKPIGATKKAKKSSPVPPPTQQPLLDSNGKPKTCNMIKTKYVDVNSTIVVKPNGPQLMSGEGIIIECRENHYFKEDAYRKIGQQVLTCKGDDTWKDALRDGVKAEQAPGKCDYGCPVPTEKQLENVTIIDKPATVITSGDDKLYKKQAVLVLKCNMDKGFIQNTDKERAEGQERLLCKGGRGGWYNMKTGQDNVVVGKCEPVCDPITKDSIDQNADLIRVPSTLEQAKKKYARSGAVAELKCKKDNQFTDPLHRNDNSQRLICKGGPAQWYDPNTGKNNAQPDNCERPGNVVAAKPIKMKRPNETMTGELSVAEHDCLQPTSRNRNGQCERSLKHW